MLGIRNGHQPQLDNTLGRPIRQQEATNVAHRERNLLRGVFPGRSARASANASATSATASPAGWRLRHDHGSNYLADDCQQEVAFFGIESSPSFVREPEGNGVAERFIRTLKENLLWVRSFDTIASRRSAWPCSSSSGRTTSSGCWRSTTIEAPPRCDVTSSGWTRQRRSEYRQTTVQEPWGSTGAGTERHGGLDKAGQLYGNSVKPVRFRCLPGGTRMAASKQVVR